MSRIGASFSMGRPTMNNAQQIVIDRGEVHRRGLGQDFVSYRINTLRDNSMIQHSVKRRYKEFSKLFEKLSAAYPNHVIPRLPKSGITDRIFRFKTDFIEKRREGLQQFLMGLAIHPILGESKELLEFLTDPTAVDLDMESEFAQSIVEHDDEDDDDGVFEGDGTSRKSLHEIKTEAIHLSTIKTISAVAKSYQAQERYDEAKDLYLQVLNGYEEEYGPYHQKTLGALENLGCLLMDQGVLDEAIEVFRKALAGKEKIFGEDHMSTLRTACICANILQDINKEFEEAKGLYDRVIKGYGQSLVPDEGYSDHPEILPVLLSYGTLLFAWGQLDAAEIHIERAAQGLLNVHGPEHELTLVALNVLADIYTEKGELESAMSLYEQARLAKEKIHGNDHPSTLQTYGSIAMVLQLQGRDDEAIWYYQKYADGIANEAGRKSVFGFNFKAPSEMKLEDLPVVTSSEPYEKYLKMLRVGVGIDSVKAKMESEGVDPRILDVILKDSPMKTPSDAAASSSSSAEEAPPPEGMIKICDHSIYAKYVKMRKAGIPKEAVQAKMMLEGADPAILERDQSELIPINYEKDEGPKVCANEHPQLAKYFKMLKLGLPVEAIKIKMTQDNVDPKYIDKDPSEMITVDLDTKIGDSKASSEKKKKMPDVRRKRLHWKAIDSSRIRNTLWGEQDEEDDDIQVDEEEFKKLFVEKIEKDNNKNAKSSSEVAKDTRKKKVHLIDMKRAQNAGIALMSLKVSLEGAKASILDLDDYSFSYDQLKYLEEYLPTHEETTLIKKYTGDLELLGKAEEYMRMMMDVPSAAHRIQCMMFKQQFTARVKDVRAKTSKIEKACDDVKQSSRFKKVLKTILKIGNQLNSGANQAEGLTVESLLNLQHAKAFDKKTSILQYVITLIHRSDISCLYFTEDLTHVPEAARINFEAATSERISIGHNLEASVNKINSIKEELRPKVEKKVEVIQTEIVDVIGERKEMIENKEEIEDKEKVVVVETIKKMNSSEEEMFVQINKERLKKEKLESMNVALQEATAKEIAEKMRQKEEKKRRRAAREVQKVKKNSEKDKPKPMGWRPHEHSIRRRMEGDAVDSDDESSDETSCEEEEEEEEVKQQEQGEEKEGLGAANVENVEKEGVCVEIEGEDLVGVVTGEENQQVAAMKTATEEDTGMREEGGKNKEKDAIEKEENEENNEVVENGEEKEKVGEGLEQKDGEENKTEENEGKAVEEEIPDYLSPGFEIMDEFFEAAGEELDEIGIYMDSVHTKFGTVLDYFGEEPDMYSQDFFSTLNKFLQEFATTRDNVVRAAKAEETRTKNITATNAANAVKKERRQTVAFGNRAGQMIEPVLLVVEKKVEEIEGEIKETTIDKKVELVEEWKKKEIVVEKEKELLSEEERRQQMIEQGKQRFLERQRELMQENEDKARASADPVTLTREQERQKLVAEGRARFEQKQKELAAQREAMNATRRTSVLPLVPHDMQENAYLSDRPALVSSLSPIIQSESSRSSSSSSSIGDSSSDGNKEDERKRLAEEGRRRFEARLREKRKSTSGDDPEKGDDGLVNEKDEEVDAFLDSIPTMSFNSSTTSKGRRASVI